MYCLDVTLPYRGKSAPYSGEVVTTVWLVCRVLHLSKSNDLLEPSANETGSFAGFKHTNRPPYDRTRYADSCIKCTYNILAAVDFFVSV